MSVLAGTVNVMAHGDPTYFDRGGAPIEEHTFLGLRADPSYRVVAREVVGSMVVTTSWLGTDQGSGPEVESPLIFGTAAVPQDGGGDPFLGVELFAPTEQQALLDHHDLVARVRTHLG